MAKRFAEILDLSSRSTAEEFSDYFGEMVNIIIYTPRAVTPRLMRRFLKKYPLYYFLFERSKLLQPKIARLIIKASNGRVFANLPDPIRSNEKLAALAWQLNPMMGYGVAYPLRRVIATPEFVRELMQFPRDQQSCCCIKYIPRAAVRRYARETLLERAAFFVFLHKSPLPGHLNEWVGQFIPIEGHRKPRFDFLKPIHWLARLRRYAV